MARDVWGTYLTDGDFEAAAKIGLSKNTVQCRIYKGWSAKRATTEPLNYQNQKCPEYQKYKQIAIENGINIRTFRSRVNICKWSLEEAATTPALSYDERAKRTTAMIRAKRGISEDLLNTALKNGIPKSVFLNRINRLFWNPIDAATVPVGSRNAGKDYIRKLNSALFSTPPVMKG